MGEAPGPVLLVIGTPYFVHTISAVVPGTPTSGSTLINLLCTLALLIITGTLRITSSPVERPGHIRPVCAVIETRSNLSWLVRTYFDDQQLKVSTLAPQLAIFLHPSG